MISGKPTIIDLFAGAGGFSLGAERAGFHVVGAAEIDPEALQIHAYNFPKTTVGRLDLGKANAEELATTLKIGRKKVTGIIGGPPCQGFSAMGRNNPKDPRNSLFSRFFYYVQEFQPEFFVVENVQGILGKKFESFVLESLELLGKNYTILKPLCLCAKDYGAPTTRTRVFIVGFRKWKTPKGINSFSIRETNHRVTVQEALKGLPWNINFGKSNESGYWRKIRGFPEGVYGEKIKGGIPEGVGAFDPIRRLKNNMEVSGFAPTNHTAEVVERFSKTAQGDQEPVSKYWRLRDNGYCPTLRAGTGRDRGSFQAARPIHPVENRVITVREAARLQGFPDWFVFSETKWASFRQIGNSVCPIVAESLLKEIYEILV